MSDNICVNECSNFLKNYLNIVCLFENNLHE